MIEARFSNKMIDTLKKLKGQELISYSTSKGIVCGGTIYIQANDLLIELSNKEIEIPWFKSKDLSDKEKIFAFCCNEIEKAEGIPFEFVREKIEKVELTTDYIHIPQKEYEIALDMALIITAGSHRYVISRGWFFDEYLNVNIDKNYDDIYPVNEVIESWNNFGDWQVSVDRCIENL